MFSLVFANHSRAEYFNKKNGDEYKVCAHLKEFFALNLNMAIKMCILKMLACSLRTTSARGGLTKTRSFIRGINCLIVMQHQHTTSTTIMTDRAIIYSVISVHHDGFR